MSVLGIRMKRLSLVLLALFLLMSLVSGDEFRDGARKSRLNRLRLNSDEDGVATMALGAGSIDLPGGSSRARVGLSDKKESDKQDDPEDNKDNEDDDAEDEEDEVTRKPKRKQSKDGKRRRPKSERKDAKNERKKKKKQDDEDEDEDDDIEDANLVLSAMKRVFDDDCDDYDYNPYGFPRGNFGSFVNRAWRRMQGGGPDDGLATSAFSISTGNGFSRSKSSVSQNGRTEGIVSETRDGHTKTRRFSNNDEEHKNQSNEDQDTEAGIGH